MGRGFPLYAPDFSCLKKAGWVSDRWIGLGGMFDTVLSINTSRRPLRSALPLVAVAVVVVFSAGAAANPDLLLRWSCHRCCGCGLLCGAKSRMNHCAVRQSALAACEEMRSPFASIVSDRRDPVFCPKPRRVGRLAGVDPTSRLAGVDPTRPLRRQLGHQADPCDSRPRSDVLDVILTKGAYDDGGHQPGDGEGAAGLGSSPPYFCSSPPSRSTNPLVLDARFGDDKAAAPLTPLPVPAPTAVTTARKGCVRTKFSPSPAAVRIEGFDCLDRDGRRSSRGITAVA